MSNESGAKHGPPGTTTPAARKRTGKTACEEREIEREEERQARRIHPGWFVGVGIVLIGLVVLTWILM
jgi:hypothetical protein